MGKWFTSDLHFHHRNIIRFCDRPFKKDCVDCDGVNLRTKENSHDYHYKPKCLSCADYGYVADVDDMNDGLIENWNSIIGKNDQVYCLGDFAFCDKNKTSELVRRLNGHIHWIYGNHDEHIRGAKGFASHNDIKVVKHMLGGKKYSFFLCHYPCVSWRKSHEGAIHVHGHCHGTLPDDGVALRFDVGVDVWDYKPVNFNTIVELAEQRKKSNLERFGMEIVPVDHH
jgi:calcineurin-like phosphoesterase family protein